MSRDVDHVIASIDHALVDYGVSGDAMRWTPDRDARPVVPPQVDPELAEAWAQLRGWIRQVCDQLGLVLSRWQEQLIEAGLIARPLPSRDDAKARALAARQRRGTGPARDIVHQRRPRRLS